MSSIAFHTRTETVELAGPERAYMRGVVRDLALTFLDDPYPHRQHRLARLIPDDPTPNRPAWAGDRDGACERERLCVGYWETRGVQGLQVGAELTQVVRHYLDGTRDTVLTFDGGTYRSANLLGNTAVALGSPAVAFMAKLESYCERHAWIAEGDRGWCADLIESALDRNLLRAGVGWDEVTALLRDVTAHPGEVVTSFSVGESFPSMSACDWMDEAWPADMVADGSYDYAALDEAGKKAVDERGEAWDDLTREARWELAFPAVAAKSWLRLQPDTLLTPSFAGPTSLLDAVASKEWQAGPTVEADRYQRPTH